MTLSISCYITLPIIVNLDVFRHIHILFTNIQPYCDIFRTLCNSCISRTLSYWKSCPGIFRTQKYTQNSLKAYSDIFRTLCNDRILTTLSYSELGTFRHTQAFSIIIVNNNMNFLFFMLILHAFQKKLKKNIWR